MLSNKILVCYKPVDIGLPSYRVMDFVWYTKEKSYATLAPNYTGNHPTSSGYAGITAHTIQYTLDGINCRYVLSTVRGWGHTVLSLSV